jgi:hypothetical protein
MGSGGRKRKLQGVEEEIIGEIDKGNYSNRQEIADMIQEKHGIKVSLPVVARLLKKGAFEMWFSCGESRYSQTAGFFHRSPSPSNGKGKNGQSSAFDAS